MLLGDNVSKPDSSDLLPKSHIHMTKGSDEKVVKETRSSKASSDISNNSRMVPLVLDKNTDVSSKSESVSIKRKPVSNQSESVSRWSRNTSSESGYDNNVNDNNITQEASTKSKGKQKYQGQDDNSMTPESFTCNSKVNEQDKLHPDRYEVKQDKSEVSETSNPDLQKMFGDLLIEHLNSKGVYTSKLDPADLGKVALKANKFIKDVNDTVMDQGEYSRSVRNTSLHKPRKFDSAPDVNPNRSSMTSIPENRPLSHLSESYADKLKDTPKKD